VELSSDARLHPLNFTEWSMSKLSMTKILGWAAGGFLAVVLLVYVVLGAFLWWGDLYDRPPSIKVDPVYVRSVAPHSVELINDGLVSLQRRLEIIDQAKKSIELEFFIYELDLASQIVTQKLVEAASRGVDVKILVDFAAPVFKLGPLYAQALQTRGIQVKYYNTSSLFRFVSAQHRSHRKLLLVDGEVAITGGRNIGNDYFNLSPSYNFLDSDALIRGPIVADIRTSFFFYWNSEFATHPPDVDGGEAELTEVFFGFVESSKTITKIQDLATSSMSRRRQHVCNDMVFATDYSGIPSYNRQVFRRLVEFLGEAKEEVLGESPYFILRPDGMRLLSDMSKRGIRQTFLTNGLASTDAYYTVSAMTYTLKGLADNKIDVRLYNAAAPTNPVLITSQTSKRWGVHAKRAVVDRKHVLIGTYNVDPRSANLNSELMLICRNQPDLAAEMIDDINDRLQRSMRLFGDGKSPLSVLINGATEEQKIGFVMALPLAKLFDFLL
jgi:cardiolipin synthase C